MVVKRIDNRGSFVAYDDEGNKYKIFQYVDILDAATFDNPDAEIEGERSLKTEYGHPVNYIAKGKYKLDHIDRMVYSDDQDAP